jgi:hypothetical protein
LVLLPVTGCGTPQIGTDRETFTTVDELYTAVGLKDSRLVDQCAAKLKTLRDAGKLPGDASRSLEAIVAKTGEGKWDEAQAHLSRFMEAQRR